MNGIRIPYKIEVLVGAEYEEIEFELEIDDYEPPTPAMSDQPAEGAHFSIGAIYLEGEKLSADRYRTVIDELTDQDYDIIGDRIEDLRG